MVRILRVCNILSEVYHLPVQNLRIKFRSFFHLHFPAHHCGGKTDPYNWLSASLSLNANPLLLQRLFGVLHRALFHNDTDTRGAAALALKHLCDAAAGHLAQFLEPLMQLYTTALNSIDMRETGLVRSTGTAYICLDNEDVLQIIEGLCYVVTALPIEQADPVLSAMLRPIATPLLQMFPDQSESVPPETSVIVLHFDRLAAVMRHVAHPELVATVFRELWPVVARGLERCGDRDERSAEHICRCIKYTFRTARWGHADNDIFQCLLCISRAHRTLRRHNCLCLKFIIKRVHRRKRDPTMRHRLKDLVAPAAALYTKMFAQRQHASILFAVSELVRSFGRDESVFETLRLSVEEVMGWTTKMFRALPDFEATPDVVDDAFLLAKVCLTHCPRIIINPRVLPAVIDMAIVGLHIQHREACCSILVFLRNTMQSRDETSTEILRQVLPSRGAAVAHSLIAGAMGSLPASRLDDVTDVIAAMLTCAGATAVEWVQAAVSRVPEHAASPVGSRASFAHVYMYFSPLYCATRFAICHY